jgi:4-hydroxy-3-methylbut-2-enyl diphosphate reductase
MEINIDTGSGFCFGVQNAVRIAEEALRKGEKVFCLGQIVHNELEIERLSVLGLVTVNYEEFEKLRDCKVLIRAHGEPPSTYRTAEKNNISILEATCPIVKRLQARIKDTWIRAKDENGQIVIFGKPGHPEVAGLLGQTGNEAILVTNQEDLRKIDLSRPVHLFAQTTMSAEDYYNIAENIRSAIAEKGLYDPDNLLSVNNTNCRQVTNRQPRLKAFSKKHDIIIFVSGRESSNGKMLYSVCKSVNPETYFVASPDEIDRKIFTGKNSVGICSATSTPKWLIDKIYDTVLLLTSGA